MNKEGLLILNHIHKPLTPLALSHPLHPALRLFGLLPHSDISSIGGCRCLDMSLLCQECQSLLGNSFHWDFHISVGVLQIRFWHVSLPQFDTLPTGRYRLVG
jgi:hypothetical protein